MENFKLPNGIEIRNNCSQLPLGAIWHIRRSLAWLNQSDVAGIGSIRLADSIAETDSPYWHQRAVAEGLSINGFYNPADQDEPATITLFVRDLYRGIPRAYWLTPAVTMLLASTLAHEVGHHLIAERGYVFAPGERVEPSEYEEEMATRYSFSVIKSMKSRWYYRLGSWITKDLAGWHYVKGMLAWKDNQYERAAESWYRSFCLDPDREDAIYWYKRAKELAAGVTSGTVSKQDTHRTQGS